MESISGAGFRGTPKPRRHPSLIIVQEPQEILYNVIYLFTLACMPRSQELGKTMNLSCSFKGSGFKAHHNFVTVCHKERVPGVEGVA